MINGNNESNTFPPPKNVYVLIPRTCKSAKVHTEGNKVAEKIKFANQLTLNRKTILHYLVGSNNITGS